MATCRRLQIDPYLSPCTKLKSKWIKDLNINPVTLNLIEEKVGSTLERIGTGDHFLNITPTAQTLSATINQWDYMKLRSFCKAKDTVTKTKHQPTEWEKIFTNPTSDRGLISRIYKELKKHDIKTPNSPIEKWAIELNREFTAEEYRMAERHLRKCSTSLLIREMQIKTTLRYHLTPVRMAKIKNTGTVHVGEDVEQEEHFSTVGGNADWYNHYGKQSCRAMSDQVVVLLTDCQSIKHCWNETQVHEELASFEMSEQLCEETLKDPVLITSIEQRCPLRQKRKEEVENRQLSEIVDVYSLPLASFELETWGRSKEMLTQAFVLKPGQGELSEGVWTEEAMRTLVSSEEWAVERGSRGDQEKALHRTGRSTGEKRSVEALTDDYQEVSVSFTDRKAKDSLLSVVSQKMIHLEKAVDSV
ncbi:hypothetical protein STEG23_001153 [Scotinomys teguina]